MSPWSEGGNSGSDDAEKRKSTSGNDSASPDGGRFAIAFGEDGWFCQKLDATGYDSLQLAYYWRGDNDAENSDKGKVEYKVNGNCSDSSGWSTLHSITDLRNDGWKSVTDNFPTNVDNKKFALRFRVDSSEDDEHLRIDGIKLLGYALPFCGDQIVNGNEQCDGDAPKACTTQDGYAGTQSCNNSCSWDSCIATEYCGDGVKNGQEQCDDGNQVNNDACSNSCTVPDRDQDGVPDGSDNCVSTPNLDQIDVDNDGVGDACDNCPSVVNQDQADADVDGIGDVCEITTETQCEDGIDNDGDEAVDCADTDCANNQACQQPTCTPGVVTIPNGDFETPLVESSNGWELFNQSQVGWTVNWVSPEEGAPDPAFLELHKSGAISGQPGYITPYGEQYAELDTDYGYGENEQASVSISQKVTTVVGASYTLSYSYSYRPGIADNHLLVKVDGNTLGDHSTDGTGQTITNWQNGSINFTATSIETTIEFVDASNPDSLGTFLDNVKLELISCPFPKATVIAQKIVCKNESDLPDWSGGADITATTAQDFVENSDGACKFQPDWKFEWGTNDNVLELAGNYVGEIDDANWYDFPLTDVNGTTQVDLNLEEVLNKVWFREVLQPGYIPFTFTSDNDPVDPVSAEFWCGKDVLNYDNAEWIQGLEENDVAYCVAINVLKPQEPSGDICGYKYEVDANGATLGTLPNWQMSLWEATDYYDQFYVDANDTDGVMPQTFFERGKTYKIEVTGTATAGDGIEFDAKYSERNQSGSWTDLVQNYESYGEALLDLQINGVSPNWGVYTNTHKYFVIMNGDDNNWTFQINDIYYPNNSGSLQVEIYELVDTKQTAYTNDNGYYCFNDLADGHYVVEEGMKEGYSVYGSPYCQTFVDSRLSQAMVVEDQSSNICNFYNQEIVEEPTLTITLTGDGIGTVSDGPEGQINCSNVPDGPNDCEGTYSDNMVVDLTVTPGEGSNFDNSWSVGGGTCTGNTTSCQLTMNQNYSLTAHFGLNGSSGGGAQISTTSSNGGSSTPQPTIDIEKTGEASVVPGLTANFTLTVTNTSAVVATNVVVTDTLPVGFTFTDNSLVTHTWDLGTMAAGEVKVISYSINIPADASGSYTNVSTVSINGALVAPQYDEDPFGFVATAVLGFETEAPAEVQVLGYESLPETGGPAGVDITWLGTLLLISGAYVMRKYRI